MQASSAPSRSDKLKNPDGCWYFYVDDAVYQDYVFRSDLGVTADTICTSGSPRDETPSDGLSVARTDRDPVGASAQFSIRLPRSNRVSFSIYNVVGRRIRTLANGNMAAGFSTLTWDGTDEHGNAVPSGIYFYRAVAGDQVVTDRMVLLR